MHEDTTIPRRTFLQSTAAGIALTAATAVQGQTRSVPATIDRKLKVGIVGLGGRGSWIANLFKEHGGYEFLAAADYFPDRAEKVGTSLGAKKGNCFSGLSAYKRLIESGVEAVILETPPYFFPEHAGAAVEAGLHVYMAKPVAVDVPGTLKIGGLGRTSTQHNRVFHVDYQMPTDPLHLEIQKRMKDGGLGELQVVFSVGTSGGLGFSDPPLTRNLEDRLTGLIWVNDDALGCGYIGNFDIHSIDAVIWALGRRPVSAFAHGGRYRKEPHGDSLDSYFVTYELADGLIWNHQSMSGPTHDWLKQGELEASIQGSLGSARLAYSRKAYLRGGPKHFGGGDVADLYAAGAKRNIAAFHQKVLTGDYSNTTAQRSVDCTLTCILGREAARRGKLLAMDDLIKENKRLEVDLSGLKV
jgi:myo-inositol 2-dehydrogenase / D-chiro-inositol 1-dehydrogenase